MKNLPSIQNMGPINSEAPECGRTRLSEHLFESHIKDFSCVVLPENFFPIETESAINQEILGFFSQKPT